MADYKINITAEDKTKGVFGSIGSGLDGLTSKVGGFKSALGIAGAALASFGAVNKIKDTIDSMDNLAKSARLAGATASEDAFKGFQVLKQAMNEAGVDAGTFERAMLQTTNRLQKGIEGSKSFKEITDKLGSSILDANGKMVDGSTALTAMINALNEGKISTDEFAKVVGGRAGPVIQQQFASLNTTADALKNTLTDVAANSNIVSLDASQNAEVFNDTLGRMSETMGQLMTDAITPLLPMLTKLAQDILAHMPTIIQNVTAAFQALQPVFELLGTVLTEIVWPILQKVFEVLGFIAQAIAPLVDSAIPALKQAFEGLKGIAEALVSFFKGVADTLQGIYDKAIQLKNATVGTFNDMKDGAITGAKDMYNGATSWANKMYDEWVGNSIFPDLANRVIQEMQRMDEGVVQTTQHMATTATQTAETGFGEFESIIQKVMRGGSLEVSDFAGIFQSKMGDILNGATSTSSGLGGIFGDMFGNLGGIFQGGLDGLLSQFSGFGSGLGGMLGNIFGGFGGGGGGGGIFGSIVSGIGSLFGGFFATGGYLPSGQFGIAGEAGPEIITGPANITPMDNMMGAAPAVSINLNVLDTQTGTEFLLRNKAQIEGIIQNAYTRRGRTGIY